MAERERNLSREKHLGALRRTGLAQELLAFRAGNEALGSDFKNFWGRGRPERQQKEVPGADLLKGLGSTSRELERKDEELTKECPQIAGRDEEAAATDTTAPPGDSQAEVRASEMKLNGKTTRKEAEAESQEQDPRQQELDQGVGKVEEPEAQPPLSATRKGASRSPPQGSHRIQTCPARVGPEGSESKART